MPGFRASCLLCLLCAPASAAWDGSLELSVAASQNDTRIYVDGAMREKRVTGLELRVDGALNRATPLGQWKNSLKIDYAGSRTKDTSNSWDAPRWTESSDQLTADSLFNFSSALFARPYLGVNVQTAVYDCTSPEEWKAFSPLQVRESAGLALPLLGSGGRDLSFRAGYFYQHYLNRGRAATDPAHGLETVLQFEGPLAANVTLRSKAGLYTGLAATDDYGSPETSSRKSVLEWDNRLEVQLSRVLSLRVTYNVDNKDVGDEEINYEVDHRTALAVNLKVF